MISKKTTVKRVVVKANGTKEIATLIDLKDIKAKKKAFADIVNQWIKQM
jgi:hypothetical protein